MPIHTRPATKALATHLAAALEEAGVDAHVTCDPETATPAILDGRPALILTPPTATANHGPALTLEWEMPIIGAPVGDQDEAWTTLDTILTVLDQLLEWTRIHPITWGGAQTATAPAYLITFTQTLYKEALNA